MEISVFHIADMHLGRRFQDHPEVADTLSEARYKTLESLVSEANERQTDIMSVGGDLFDRRSMKKADVQRAAHILNRFTGKTALVLPGNHDYISEGAELWQRFKEEAEDHILLLQEAEPVSLETFGIDATVYPGPCRAKHSAENGIRWIKEVEKNREFIHIGIAHGSIEGVSPDFEQRYYPMTLEELKDAGVDIWLLGHTHITWPENPDRRDFVFNPGTPEPDGFACRHPGRAFCISIDENKEISAEILNCGLYRFRQRREKLYTKEDIQKLEASLEEDEFRRVVLKLTVEGRLEPEVYEYWKERIPELRKAVLELKLDDGKLLRSITIEQISKEFPKDSLPEKLLSRFAEAGDSQALQRAYELIRRAQEDNHTYKGGGSSLGASDTVSDTVSEKSDENRNSRKGGEV
ncbi:MAG: metallophosphoesterase [Spirochaetia bacterium]